METKSPFDCSKVLNCPAGIHDYVHPTGRFYGGLGQSLRFLECREEALERLAALPTERPAEPLRYSATRDFYANTPLLILITKEEAQRAHACLWAYFFNQHEVHFSYDLDSGKGSVTRLWLPQHDATDRIFKDAGVERALTKAFARIKTAHRRPSHIPLDIMDFYVTPSPPVSLETWLLAVLQCRLALRHKEYLRLILDQFVQRRECLVPCHALFHSARGDGGGHLTSNEALHEARERLAAEYFAILSKISLELVPEGSGRTIALRLVVPQEVYALVFDELEHAEPTARQYWEFPPVYC